MPTVQNFPFNSTFTTSRSLGWFNVMDYGATGNGVSDDSTAILATFAAATAAFPVGAPSSSTAQGPIVYFPPGQYYYNSATPIVLTPYISVLQNGGAVIIGGTATTHCFVLQCPLTPYEAPLQSAMPRYVLPSVVDFANGVGLRYTTGVQYTDVYVPTIAQCLHGVDFYLSGNNLGGGGSGIAGPGVYSNILRFNSIALCTNGLRIISNTGSSDSFAFNFITGGGVGLCTNNILYQGFTAVTSGSFIIPAALATVSVTTSTPYGGTNGDQVLVTDGAHSFFGKITAGAGSTALTVENLGQYPGSATGYVGQTMASGATINAWYQYVAANQFDIATMSGQTVGSVGIRLSGGIWGPNYSLTSGSGLPGSSYRSKATWSYFESGSVVATAGGQLWGAKFDILGDGTNSTGYSEWAGLRNTIPGFVTGNQIVAEGQPVSTYTAAVTTSGSGGQAAFGTPIYASKIVLKIAISGLLAGNSTTVFAYSPYALGHIFSGAKFTLTSGPGGLQVAVVEDETQQAGLLGGPYPSQIGIQLYNGSGATITQTVYGILEVGT